jgi:two-component system NtrC family response regulator
MATVLIVDDDAALREGLAETVADLGHQPHSASTGREALTALAENHVDCVLLDLRMPGGMDGIEVLRRIRALDQAPPVIVLTAFATAENTIEAMRLGAFDHLTKPIGRDELNALLSSLPGRRRNVGSPAAGTEETGTLIGSSEAMRRVQKMIGMAADTDATVLILGETGTGKELVARALHKHSQRKPKPFVAVNCAAIPAELLESELFGHVRGSFTGATADRTGALREAEGGTLFLDEIGDMPAQMQGKILRALQERVVTPIGGKPCQVDVRVIAATHRDIGDLVASGAFREDLYYRLNVVPIVLPPLRDRADDVLPLAKHFLRLTSRTGSPKRFSAAAEARLLDHTWPGNVRELRNVIERASVLARGDVIEPADLNISHPESHFPPREELIAGDLPSAVAKLEAAMIRNALDACGGNRAEAARRLNINRQLLYTKMERYGILEAEPSGKPTSRVGKVDT